MVKQADKQRRKPREAPIGSSSGGKRGFQYMFVRAIMLKH